MILIPFLFRRLPRSGVVVQLKTSQQCKTRRKNGHQLFDPNLKTPKTSGCCTWDRTKLTLLLQTNKQTRLFIVYLCRLRWVVFSELWFRCSWVFESLTQLEILVTLLRGATIVDVALWDFWYFWVVKIVGTDFIYCHCCFVEAKRFLCKELRFESRWTFLSVKLCQILKFFPTLNVCTIKSPTSHGPLEAPALMSREHV